MGRKQKRKGGGKSKGASRGKPAGANRVNLSEVLGRGNDVIRAAEGGGMVKTGLEHKAQRDNLDAMLANPEHTKDIEEKYRQLAHFIQVTLTLKMAQCGIIDDQKHSSIVYAEQHADVLFSDGGQSFFRQLREATEKVAQEKKMKDEMEKCQREGDEEGQLRLLQAQMRALDLAEDERRAKEGLPPLPPQKYDPCHCSIVDDELFKPCPPPPECPICLLPLPERGACTYQPCCGKTLCDGCMYAHHDSCEEYCCPFCRASMGIPDTESVRLTEQRAELGDRDAVYMLGAHNLFGRPPVKKNGSKGLELMKRAADLGLDAAHHYLGVQHAQGGGGVERDMKKAMYHLRLAAIDGCLESRYDLGVMQEHKPELAFRHFIIAAEAGHKASLEKVKRGYSRGDVEKHVLARVLRSHKAVEDEVWSEQRLRAVPRRAAEVARHG